MYNTEELGNFSNSETRLKQLILKLKEQEESNAKLKSAVQVTKQEMNF